MLRVPGNELSVHNPGHPHSAHNPAHSMKKHTYEFPSSFDFKVSTFSVQ
jgi:hypothetical protein